jgi:glycosyltransferase involved in cell wall biosynthesis
MNDSRRIAIIVPSLRNCGPVNVAYNIVDGLKHREDLLFNVFYLDKKGSVKFDCTSEQLSVRNFWQLYKYDVVHSHSLRPDFVNFLIPFFSGTKITTIHNIVEEDLRHTYGSFISKVFSALWRLLWRGIDKPIVLSKVAQEYYSSTFPKVVSPYVIYNGVKKPRAQSFKSDSNLSSVFQSVGKERLRLGTVCLFNRRKGLEQLFYALPQLEEASLFLIGDGPVRKQLEELAEQLEISDRIHFLGFRDDASSFIPKFDVYCMPSREEGFSLALLEAALSRVPIVLSEIPVFRETFTDDEASFFQLDDVDSLVGAIKNASSNDDMAKNAFAKVVKSFSHDRMCKSYELLYKNSID